MGTEMREERLINRFHFCPQQVSCLSWALAERGFGLVIGETEVKEMVPASRDSLSCEQQRPDACAHLWTYLVSETCLGSRQAARRALIQSGGKSRKVPGKGEAWSFSSEQDYRLAKYIRWGKGILCRGNVIRESMVMRQLDQVHHPMACVLGAHGNNVWRGKSQTLGIAKDWSFYPDMEGI